MLAQVQDYLELIQDQIVSQVHQLVRKPTRSLSAGATRERRELKDFKHHQNAYITVFNLILDSYIRVRHAFQELDELWLYLLQYAYPSQELLQAGNGVECLFEQLHKRIFSEMMGDYYIAAFQVQCSMQHAEMRT